jgi:peptide chain release factor 1
MISLDRLKEIENYYEEIEGLLSKSETLKDPSSIQKYAKERAELIDLVKVIREYKKILSEIEQSQELLHENDDEIRELAKAELHNLKKRQEDLEREIHNLILPKDPYDDKNIFLEIRAGAGGEEAALFVADIFRMYARYAERRGWKVDVISQNSTGVGGKKEIIALVEGKGAYSRLKFERGVHRVQRVPITESQGRIHTSTVTVAILPEAEDIDIQIDPQDLKIDVFRSSGPGGQSVNTTDSAVRITHIPTGMVVTCQDEKSQHKNKAKALMVLKARLLDKKREEQQKEISLERRKQVGRAERSEKIRTYNFPQGRVTDHRIGLTIYKLENIMDGDLDELIDALIAHYRAEAVKQNEGLDRWKRDAEKKTFLHY